MSIFTVKVEAPSVAKCPSCGGRLTLYRRPVNAEYLVCIACHDEFTPDYLAGYSSGITRAAEQRNEAALPALELLRKLHDAAGYHTVVIDDDWLQAINTVLENAG